VRGLKVDFNGYQLPPDAPWAANQIDPARIRADATKARSRGADLVVASLHFGTECDSQPSAYQRNIVSHLVPATPPDLRTALSASYDRTSNAVQRKPPSRRVSDPPSPERLEARQPTPTNALE